MCQKSRINRNIVECKVHRQQRPLKKRHRINRNIVECKERTMTITSISRLVLIETLWNVKLYNSRKGIWSNVVLIETLWNVKQIASSVHP